ncbi:hypothetical protein [Methylorubrum podarium]|uniref:hypothetical protein n=1 Tax=Methylorubrum podarium TaxID=200476 RepID=UPI001EE22917|nr:hypothetical protein [Methylorubrum podarium]GJE71025.1 hypothetical protein CHKEEEPN_2567 [Methylorubrum podarium]
MRSIDAPTYRSLRREKATYPGRLEGYVPYAANHEPPDRTATEQRARIVAGRVITVAEERAAQAAALLEREGIVLAPNPEAWDAAGRWLAEHVEGSREPGSDRYAPALPRRDSGRAPTQVGGESTTQLRPLWRCLALDLGLLLGQHMIAARPGAGWTVENALRRRAASVSGEPLIVADGIVLGAPLHRIRDVLHAALLARLGLRNEAVPPLGDAMRRLVTLDDPANRDDPAADLIAELEEFVMEYGVMPSEEDLRALPEQFGLDVLPPLPPDLEALRRRPAPARRHGRGRHPPR